jgi:hypothetical protein
MMDTMGLQLSVYNKKCSAVVCLSRRRSLSPISSHFPALSTSLPPFPPSHAILKTADPSRATSRKTRGT